MVKSSSRSTKEYGSQGEHVVASWLQQHGWKILAMNFSCRYGEIDVIARKRDVVAFVEVKSRVRTFFALSELITESKRRRIIKTAQLFTQQHRLEEVILRFDAAFVQGTDADRVEYIENAFTADMGE